LHGTHEHYLRANIIICFIPIRRNISTNFINVRGFINLFVGIGKVGPEIESLK